jgi:succinate dehydrogenase / fumarate reductase cytochrome b subunit
VIALSGLLLALFLVAHLAGASLALVAPAAFESWAAALHRQPWLPAVEIAVAAGLLLHPLQTLRRAWSHAVARGPVAAVRVSRRSGALEALAARAGRWQVWSGGLVLLFLAVHLGQLRLHRPLPGAELAAVRAALAPPAALALYAAAGVAVGLHLLHGHESAHRSLGLLDSENAGRIRAVGRLLALLLGAGFTLLPLALALPGSFDGP